MLLWQYVDVFLSVLDAVFAYRKDASILLITHRKVGLDAMDEVLVLE